MSYYRQSDDKAKWPIQIDPPDCGCTECIIGMYVPLDSATDKQMRKMLAGKIRDATGQTFTIVDGVASTPVFVSDGWMAFNDDGTHQMHLETLEWSLQKH